MCIGVVPPFAEYSGESQFPNHAFATTAARIPATSRTGLANCEWFGLRHSYGGCDQSNVVIRSVAFPVLPVRLGTASGLLRRPASAQLLLCSRTLPVLAPPPSPQKSSFLSGEPRPLAFGCPRQTGGTRRNVCTSIESPLSVSSAATPKERPPTQPTSRSFRLRLKRPGRTMPDPGNPAPSGIDVWPSGN